MFVLLEVRSHQPDHLEQRIRNTVSIASRFISQLSNMAIDFIPSFSYELMPLQSISKLEDEPDNGIQPKSEMDTCSWNDFRRQRLSFNPTNSEIDSCVEILVGNNNLSNLKDIQPGWLDRPFDPTTGCGSATRSKVSLFDTTGRQHFNRFTVVPTLLKVP